MKIGIKTGSKIITQRLKYVFDFINDHPLNDGKLILEKAKGLTYDKTIQYGGKNDGSDYYIPSQNSFFNENQYVENHWYLNPYIFQGNKLFSVELRKNSKEKLFYIHGQFSFDVFESIFFHISRYEEYYFDSNRLDKMGMVPHSDLLLQKNKLEQVPVVDRLVEAMLKCMGIELTQRKTAFVLTHDIDKIFKYNSLLDGIKSFAWPLVYKYDLRVALRNLFSYIKVRTGQMKDPYDSYDFLFRNSPVWSEKIVYFMAGGNTRYDLFDRFYIRDISSIVNKAKKCGYKMGIHPSFDTPDDVHLWREEKKWLEETIHDKITLSRQHFLHFYPDKTPSVLNEVGISKDSTLGYTRRIGFRSGTGFDHYLYDFAKEKPHNFAEIPLVFMDSSLIHLVDDNMSYFENTLFSFIDKNSRGTRITFNFHNSTFDTNLRERKALEDIYIRLEEYLEQL